MPLADPARPSILDQQLLRESQYGDERRKLISKYPNLEHNDYKLWTSRQYSPRGRLACINFNTDGQAPEVHHLSDDNAVSTLRSELTKNKLATTSGTTRRLFLLEGCYDERSTVLGAYLRIPHLFWMRHAKVAIWESNKDTAGNLPPLPSTTVNSDSFCFSYCQMMHLGDDIKDFSLRCAENERHIALSRLNGKLDGVGTVHRKVSFWARTTGSDGWDVVVVVDAPFKRALGGKRKAWTLIEPEETPTPFQGGYADFMPYKDLDDMLRTDGPQRSSTFDDLLYYYSTHWSALTLTSKPRSSAVFIEKLVASEYVVLTQYFRALLSCLHWSLSRHRDFSVFDTQWVAESWSDLMSFQRRLQDHCSSVQTIYHDLKMHTASHTSEISGQQSEQQEDWHQSLQDFNYVEDQLSDLTERTEQLVTAFTALSGVKSAEQSLSEAQSVRILTILGVIFLPLSLVAAIFSMADQYGPGGSKFWAYFAVAVPVTTIVFFATVILLYGIKLLNQRKTYDHVLGSPKEYKEFRDVSTTEKASLATSHNKTLLPYHVPAP